MPNYVYPWKRFWYPRENFIDLSDGGYLYRPDVEWADRFFSDNLTPLEDLASIPCLILLGEPGLGKSQELNQMYMFTRDHLRETVLQLDFGAYQEQSMLARAIFDNDTFQEWLHGIHHLNLFLDSLDEGLLSIPTLARFLAIELGNYRDHLARLSLRITCRAAEWPAFMEEELQGLWGEANIRIFRLAPLRRDDVRVAATTHGLDADIFLKEIDRKTAVPLANRPITLHFLLDLYQEHSTFPSTQQALYEEGSLILCKEANASRRSARFTGKFTARQRLAAAERLAYLMVFTNRSEVWNGVYPAEAPVGSLQFYECSGGTEIIDGNSMAISEALLTEACDTALFSSRGPDRREWAHRTYAEYLAAHYISSHQLLLPQIMMLLLHTDANEQRLIPQLHETAAWLATMQPSVFRAIMKTDAEVLLQSDVATTNEQDRADLVAALLALEPEERLLNVNLNMGQYYSKLLHPNLHTQLVAIISDHTRSISRRVVAIEIAEACQLQTLSSDLVALALDHSETLNVREAAAQAVAQIGDDISKVKLKPLAVEQRNDDPDDELKGHGLHAIWPTHIKSKELFAALTPPKREDFIGAYRVFLSSEIVPHLKLEDLPIAIQWAEQHPPRVTMQGLIGEFKSLVDAIILLALEHLGDLKVLEAFANLILVRLQQFGLFFGITPAEQETTKWLDNDETRHRLLEAIILLAQHNSDSSLSLLLARPPLLLSRDLPWLINFLTYTQVRTTQQLVSRLIGRLVDKDDPAQMQTVIEASRRLPFLANEVAQFFKPVELSSPEAAQMKRTWIERQQVKPLSELNQKPSVQPTSLIETIETQLRAFESGEYVAWSYLTQKLRNMSDDKASGNVKVDLTAYSTWHPLEDSLKRRLVEAAKQYLQKEGPDPQVWLNLDLKHYHTFALANYQALYMVLQKDPDFLTTLPKEAWKRLVSIILTSSLLLPDAPGDKSNSVAHNRLISAAHHYAPTELVDSIIRLLEREQWGCTSTYWNLLGNIKEAWDSTLTDALLTKVSDRTLAPECLGSLLSILMIHGVEAAKIQAKAFLTLPLPTNEHERQHTLAAALALVQFTEDAGWSVVWPAIESDNEFGTQLIASISYLYDWNAQQLTEEQLADLYLWMDQEYSLTHFLDHGTSFVIKEGDNISTWGIRLLQQLKERGTVKACQALERIAHQTVEPQKAQLEWIAMEARTILRQRTWIPYSPADLLKVISNSRVRLIQNADQLLEVVLESLQRLEATFHDETPAWRDVWDRLPATSPQTQTTTRHSKRRSFTYRPIDENEFSDYIKRHLQEDLGSKGIIANREVVIRSDERIDIRIDAIAHNIQEELYKQLSLIIEVKGCWNRELMTAMQTQLVDRYLRDNHCQHGLYLIGWFNCQAWDSQDYRKRNAPRISIEEAQALFAEQAASLSQQATIKAMLLDTTIREKED